MNYRDTDYLSHRIVLQRIPDGLPCHDDFCAETVALAEPGKGEMLCETLSVSIDPYVRVALSGNYPGMQVPVGDLIPGEAISRVRESNISHWPAGQLIASPSGWQDRFISDGKDCRPISSDRFPPSLYLGVLGMPGLTAYAALKRLAPPKADSTLVISAAAGAVGSAAGQIARNMDRNCQIIGIAGNDRKCQWVKEQAGFDECINHRTMDVDGMLGKCCPDGIDLYFDNVGGTLLETVASRMHPGGRVILCGMISQYNGREPLQIPDRLQNCGLELLQLNVYDHEDLRTEMENGIGDWIMADRFHYLEDWTTGLDRAPEAFINLMKGHNLGKSLVKIRN